jgi:hypothetical protein
MKDTSANQQFMVISLVCKILCFEIKDEIPIKIVLNFLINIYFWQHRHNGESPG